MPDLLEEAKRLSEIKTAYEAWANSQRPINTASWSDIHWLVERVEQERAENERLIKVGAGWIAAMALGRAAQQREVEGG